MFGSFKYWDDCVDPEDLQLLWNDKAVSKEWADANERIRHKVHLSRDPDGQSYLTQIEMRVRDLLMLNDHGLREDLSHIVLALRRHTCTMHRCILY